MVLLVRLASSCDIVYDQDRIYKAVNPKSSTVEIAITGTFDEVQKYFEEKHWSDGISITPPTTDKIEKYLLFTPYQRDTVLVNGATAYNVAVNAVMSGCSPQMMPICIAITEAMRNNGVINTLKNSHSSTPYAWINGPIGRQLYIDNGQGMISNYKNKALARFINLALLNIMGIDINSNSSPFGSVGPYVFAEDEAACMSLKWNPYHVDLGKNLNDNTLTFSTATCWGNNLTPATPDPEKIKNVIADDITEKQDSALGSGNSHCYRTIFISQSIADNLKDGYTTKAQLEDALIESAKRPFYLRAYAKYLADPNENHTNIDFDTFYNNLLNIESDITTYENPPEWYSQILQDSSTKIYTTSVMKKGETRILILGDNSRNKVQTLSGGQSVTIDIKLPNKWDALLEQINQDPKTFEYLEPISKFFLNEAESTYDTGKALNDDDIDKFSEPNPLYMYSIMSPVGKNAVDMITQAPRLDTLAGKRIALVGRSFGAPITQAVIKELIERDYPTATVFTVDDVGYGGSYSVFNPSEQNKEFQQKLKDYKIDAVISGNCGCGLCTVKEAGSAICAEYIGIPTVTVGAPAFIAEIHSTGTNRGVPVLRTVEYPRAFTSETTSELQKNARDILYPNIVKALTTEITPEEIQAYSKDSERVYNEVIVSGTYEMIHEFAKMTGWSDGLPINLPTEKKVEEYLNYTPYNGRSSIGIIPVAYREARVYTIAVNAIMADVPPEYMPLCIAFVQGMSDAEWRKPLSSTHGWSPYAWINGPIARQLGISCGKGMINNVNNKKFARFIDFAMLNIGGYYIKENRMGTYGYLTPWTFSEDEKTCQKLEWNPYHVNQGYKYNDNTITAASALFWGSDLTPQTNDYVQLKNLVSFDITEKQQNALGNTSPQVYRTILLTQNIVQILKNKYKGKSEFEDDLINTARRLTWLRVYARYWANPGGAQYTQYTLQEYYDYITGTEDEGAKMTNVPPWYQKMLSNTDQIMTGATMIKGNTPILITGDSRVNRVQIMPGGGYSTVKIELPDNWDQLTQELGYKSLKSFYLEKEEEPQIIGPINVGNILPDESFRVMNSVTQVNSRGKIFADITTGIVTYYTSKSEEAIQINNPNLALIIASLGTSSSIKVTNGIISHYIIRPSGVTVVTQKDVSALDSNVFNDANINISATEGSTPSGSSIVLSSTVNHVMFDLDGDIEILNGNTPGFLVNNDGLYTLNSQAKYESIARIGVKTSENTYRLFTITKGLHSFIITFWSSVKTYTVTYHANGGVGEDYVVTNVATGEYVLLSLTDSRFTPQENKQFVGWAKSKDGKVIKEPVINIEGNTEIYALWKDIEQEQQSESESEQKSESESEQKSEIQPEQQQIEAETSHKSGLGTGSIVGIIVAAIVVLGAAGFCVYYFVIRKRKMEDSSSNTMKESLALDV